MATFPATVQFTTITGRFVKAVGDTSQDADRDPDLVPLQGTITFTPSVARVRIADANNPMTVFGDPIICKLDADGYLLGPDNGQGVEVLATTDTGIPSYQVKLELAGQAPFTVNIAAPAGTPVDLSTALEIPADPASQLDAWLNAANRAETAAALAQQIADQLTNHPGTGTVTAVNGVEPDSDGNVTLTLPTGDVKTVNGVSPDSNGNVAIEVGGGSGDGTVTEVNGVQPDSDGKVTLGVDDIAALKWFVPTVVLPAGSDDSSVPAGFPAGGLVVTMAG